MHCKILPATLFVVICAAAQQPAPQHETVVVTGTFEPISLEEFDRAIRVLQARSQALMLNTLVDLLRLDPSLDLRERAPDGVQADLSIRGAGYGQTLVLMNGQRMNDAQSAHHNMDIPVPLEAVTRVEVLRGSGSTMYGSDAGGGVINIITEPPQGWDVRLRGAAGSFGTNQERLSMAGGAGHLSEQLVFSRNFSTGFAPDRDYRNLSLSSSTHLATRVGESSLTLAYMDHPFGADQFYGNYNSWENTKTWFLGFQQSFGENTTASFGYRRHSDLFVLYRDRPEIFTNHHSDESYQFSLRRHDEAGKSTTFSYGIEGLHESVISNNLGNHARTRGAAYLAVDVRALRRFSFSLAGREEIYRNFSGTFNPTAAVGYWMSQRVKLRASVSRSFRVPGYTDLYYHDPANLGSPNLRPEHGWNYEGGLDWNPSARVRGELTLFHRRERDGIDYYRTSPTDIWRALNIQQLNFSGVETGLRVVPARGQTLDFRYTGLRGVQDTIPVGLTKYTFNYPKQSAVVSWEAARRDGLMIRSRVGMLDRRERDPYTLWDVYLAYSRGKIHPFLQVSNVTSTSYQEILGVPMPGRTVIGGFEWVLRRSRSY